MSIAPIDPCQDGRSPQQDKGSGQLQVCLPIGYHKTRYPEHIPKESLKRHQKQSQRISHLLNPGLARTHRLSTSLLASYGRPRRPTKSPPRVRPHAGGLNREPIFRLTRSPARKASDEMSILCLARSRLGNDPSLPPRPVSPTARRVPLMRQPLLQYQPDDGSTLRSCQRDGKSCQCHTVLDRARRGLPATVLWCCAHDQRLHYTVPPNPLLRAFRCKEYKVDLSKWT